MPRPKVTDDLLSVVLVTCWAGAAETTARAVMDGRAAACVNILPGVRSLHWWKGKVEDANECLLLIKTRTVLLGELARVVRGVHPYEVPEIVALPITRGYRPYLNWIGVHGIALNMDSRLEKSIVGLLHNRIIPLRYLGRADARL
jgi:periplasmic divalent cation tolerance protein